MKIGGGSKPRAAQKSLTPLIGIVVIVRAGAVECGGGDPAPFVRPECEALAAQQRWPDGLVPAVALQAISHRNKDARILLMSALLPCGRPASHLSPAAARGS
jgi:hypothetical protein